MLLRYNVCKAKASIPSGHQCYDMGSVIGRRVKGCRVMATRYLEVSERVRSSESRYRLLGGEGTSVELRRPNNGRWVSGLSRLASLTLIFLHKQNLLPHQYLYCRRTLLVSSVHFLSQFSLEILNNFKISSHVVLDRYRVRSYGLHWSGSGYDTYVGLRQRSNDSLRFHTESNEILTAERPLASNQSLCFVELFHYFFLIYLTLHWGTKVNHEMSLPGQQTRAYSIDIGSFCSHPLLESWRNADFLFRSVTNFPSFINATEFLCYCLIPFRITPTHGFFLQKKVTLQ
jgi:hypothetical protein